MISRKSPEMQNNRTESITYSYRVSVTQTISGLSNRAFAGTKPRPEPCGKIPKIQRNLQSVTDHSEETQNQTESKLKSQGFLKHTGRQEPEEPRGKSATRLPLSPAKKPKLFKTCPGPSTGADLRKSEPESNGIELAEGNSSSAENGNRGVEIVFRDHRQAIRRKQGRIGPDAA